MDILKTIMIAAIVAIVVGVVLSYLYPQRCEMCDRRDDLKLWSNVGADVVPPKSAVIYDDFD